MQAFIAVMLLKHHMTLTAFIACEALFGMASAFFGPAADGLVPQTIEPDDLQSANALLGISRNTLNVFGPAVSGLLLVVAGPGYVFAIDAGSFIASAAFSGATRRRRARSARRSARSRPRSAKGSAR